MQIWILEGENLSGMMSFVRVCENLILKSLRREEKRYIYTHTHMVLMNFRKRWKWSMVAARCCVCFCCYRKCGVMAMMPPYSLFWHLFRDIRMLSFLFLNIYIYICVCIYTHKHLIPTYIISKALIWSIRFSFFCFFIMVKKSLITPPPLLSFGKITTVTN